MTYTYTDEQLNYLNQGENVYSVNKEYAQTRNKKLVTAKATSLQPTKETNTLTTPDGQEFRVIATKSDIQTGFDGMVVALFVND